ncbi:MAG: phosphatase PAP2 family protein [Acidobacteriaceae bacterium]
MRLFFAAFLLFAVSFPALAWCQSSPECVLSAPKVCALHVVQDEVGILASPSRTTTKDLFWLVPFGVATGVAIDYDAHAMRSLGRDPHREDRFNTISDLGGLYAPIAASGAGYFIGDATHNGLMRETAVLSAEAAVDSAILNEGLKYATDRERPNQGDGTGRFWPHGTKTWPDGQSMPSLHTMVVWSFAHVVADQYNGPATKAIVYSLATTVSVSRVLARQHFPSDVLVGSVFGYLIGGYVESRRSREAGRVSFSAVDTPNGRGLQLSYNFAH